MMNHIKNLTLAEYRKVFMEADFWRAYLEEIARRHEIKIKTATTGEPGTYPVFVVNEQYVFKLFGDLFSGPRRYDAERTALEIINSSSAIPASKLVGRGKLFPEENTWQWPYLILNFIDGESYDSVRKNLDSSNALKIAENLGEIVGKIHKVHLSSKNDQAKISKNSYHQFIEGQKAKVLDNHKKWNTLPPHLIGQIPAYLRKNMATSSQIMFLHGDLHDEHLLLTNRQAEWAIEGIIDWGDALTGNIYYELPPIHLSIFRANKSQLKHFLQSYKWPDRDPSVFSRAAMAACLLHEFNVLQQYSEDHELMDYRSLDDLAEVIWNYTYE